MTYNRRRIMEKTISVAWYNRVTKKYGTDRVLAKCEEVAKLKWKAKHPGRQWQWITTWENYMDDTHKTYDVELDVYFWDDDACMVYTSGGTFPYSDVIPNDDFSKVVVIYEW